MTGRSAQRALAHARGGLRRASAPAAAGATGRLRTRHRQERGVVGQRGRGRHERVRAPAASRSPSSQPGGHDRAVATAARRRRARRDGSASSSGPVEPTRARRALGQAARASPPPATDDRDVARPCARRPTPGSAPGRRVPGPPRRRRDLSLVLGLTRRNPNGDYPPGRMRRLPTLTPRQYERVTLIALVLLFAIVLTGAAVRLTGSGLGCTNWPKCGDSVTPPLELNAWIEFGNRLVTGVVGHPVPRRVRAGVPARRRARRDLDPPRRRCCRSASLAQAALGALTVIFELKPGFVMAHFLLSMAILAAAVALYWRARHEPAERRAEHRAASTHRHARPARRSAALALFAGTLATAAGPHPGHNESDEPIGRLQRPRRRHARHAHPLARPHRHAARPRRAGRVVPRAPPRRRPGAAQRADRAVPARRRAGRHRLRPVRARAARRARLGPRRRRQRRRGSRSASPTPRPREPYEQRVHAAARHPHFWGCRDPHTRRDALKTGPTPSGGALMMAPHGCTPDQDTDVRLATAVAVGVVVAQALAIWHRHRRLLAAADPGPARPARLAAPRRPARRAQRAPGAARRPHGPAEPRALPRPRRPRAERRRARGRRARS